MFAGDGEEYGRHHVNWWSVGVWVVKIYSF